MRGNGTVKATGLCYLVRHHHINGDQYEASWRWLLVRRYGATNYKSLAGRSYAVAAFDIQERETKRRQMIIIT